MVKLQLLSAGCALLASSPTAFAQPPMPPFPPALSAACNTTLTKMSHGMVNAWGLWAAHVTPSDCLRRCIPSTDRIHPTPGKIYRCQCCDPDSAWELDYIQTCTTQGGAAWFKDVDLEWGAPHDTCKGVLGKATPCVLTTSEIACMPIGCTAADAALVGAMETQAFCPTMAAYNLTSCAIKFVAPPTDEGVGPGAERAIV